MAGKKPVASRDAPNNAAAPPEGSDTNGPDAGPEAAEARRQPQADTAASEPIASPDDSKAAQEAEAVQEPARESARQIEARRRKELREEHAARLRREQDEMEKRHREDAERVREEEKRWEDIRFDDFLQRQILSSWITLIFGVAVVFAVLSLVAAFVDMDLPDRARIAGIVIPGLIAGILIACGISIPRMRRARSVLRAREEEAKQKAKQATEELSDATDLSQQLRANRKQIAAYDDLARLQSKEAFRNSQVAIFAGMITLIIGALVAILVPDATAKVTTATLTGIGGLLAGYISRTFLRVYERTQAQLTYFFQQPLINSYVLSAERLIAEHVSDEDKKGEQVSNVIDRILAVLVQLPESWSAWAAPAGVGVARRRRRTMSEPTGGNAKPDGEELLPSP